MKIFKFFVVTAALFLGISVLDAFLTNRRLEQKLAESILNDDASRAGA